MLREYPRSLFNASPPLAREPARTARGGLLAWQVRRLKEYVETHLGEPICVQDMAAVLGLSPSHFCRSFRLSVALSPHNYVMRRRIERAQTLMLTTDVPLIRIATDCGLADQAHLNRVFRRLTGETPAAWRRIRLGS
jgi:AraC-like DNA-binding protein